MTVRRALAVYAVYVTLALAFGAALWWWQGAAPALDYLAAYVLEMSLSFDNILVWLIIFERMQVPEEARQKALFWGIAGALALRGAFILAGAALLAKFEWLLYVLGAVVLVSGIRMLRGRSEAPDPQHSRTLRLVRRFVPMTSGYVGRELFVRRAGGWCATPLFAALVLIDVADLVFALDSIPAIFGVTRDPLIVYSSNVFAVLGLRALYFALAGAIERLRYLRYGLALILAFIGLKMLASGFVELPVWLTLGVTATVLAGTVIASIARRR